MSTEATKPEKLSYKQTLNLPQTTFPMEAKLTANEPALQFWDAANEPDGARGGPPARTRALVIAGESAGLLHQVEAQFGTHTPITIGCIHVDCMKETAATVDVLSVTRISSSPPG